MDVEERLLRVCCQCWESPAANRGTPARILRELLPLSSILGRWFEKRSNFSRQNFTTTVTLDKPPARTRVKPSTTRIGRFPLKGIHVSIAYKPDATLYYDVEGMPMNTDICRVHAGSDCEVVPISDLKFLNVPATISRAPEINLTCKRIPSHWLPIHICSATNKPLTALDIIKSIHLFFHKPVTRVEWDSLMQGHHNNTKMEQSVLAASRKRQKLWMDNESFRRSDFLDNRTIFNGVKEDSGIFEAIFSRPKAKVSPSLSVILG